MAVVTKTRGWVAIARSSSAYVAGSAARALGEQAECRENQRLSLEIELFDLAGGAVELFPYLRNPRKASRAFGLCREAVSEPVPHGVEKCFESRIVGSRERVAERVHGRRVERGKAAEELDDPLPYGKRAAAEQCDRAGDAALRGARGLPELRVVLGTLQGRGGCLRDVLLGKRTEHQAPAARANGRG